MKFDDLKLFWSHLDLIFIILIYKHELIQLNFYRKIVELEEELRVVGNNLKSLEVSEEKVSQTTKCQNWFANNNASD